MPDFGEVASFIEVDPITEVAQFTEVTRSSDPVFGTEVDYCDAPELW
ncbi:hypothetical protein [Neorhodopirellula lusitana]|nr:hypothetical protein [Neorhodopirellula lusitana]